MIIKLNYFNGVEYEQIFDGKYPILQCIAYMSKNCNKCGVSIRDNTNKKICNDVFKLLYDVEIKKLRYSDVSLTENETKVMDYLKRTLHNEYNFSETLVSDVAECLNIDIKRFRGYIGSLVKKDLIYIEEYENFNIEWKPVIQHYIHFTDIGYFYVDRQDEIC